MVRNEASSQRKEGEMSSQLSTLAAVMGWSLAIFLAVIEGIIIWYIIGGRINLERLISEKTGDASLSRFQFMIFTFVIAMGLFLIIVNSGGFPSKIPGEILALLGISGGSYVISKGIQKASEGSR
jgi:hypothetical protein